MRHPPVIPTFLAVFGLLIMSWSGAFAVPVFLKPDCRFATGNQARAKLENRTHKVQFQRWFRVQTKDKAYGWIAEDHALTALKLVDQAKLIEDTPSRTSPDLDATFGRPILKKSTFVLILEISGSWARIQAFPAAEQTQAWVPTEKLEPMIADGGAQRAFVYQRSPLRTDAKALARKLTTIEEGTYVQILRFAGDWIEVRSGRYQGYLKSSDVWTARELGDKGIRAAISLAPLRSSPLPYADLIRSLSYSSTLTYLTSAKLRWGLASTREQGDVWWPMSDDLIESDIVSSERLARTSDVMGKISTSEVFSRKIYDMASSSTVPALKFVSAEGIFRTIDGSQWTKIPLFRDQNYPIAVAKSGSIFIGPYLSDDEGETFQHWIRWDALVSSLSRKLDVAPQNLKILEIRPEDSAGHKVTLRLNLGVGEPVRVATDDQGVTWRLF